MITNIPYTAPASPLPHPGLLYAPVTDWLGWLITLLALCAMPLMTRQGRESLKALWAPVGAFLRSLCCPWACFLWTALPGAFLEAVRPVIAPAFLQNSIGREQLRRLAFSGYMRPVLT